jgi:hypothetical protein
MTRPRELRFNAFNMTAPSHNWAGLWSHPRDASIDYNTLDYWVDYARTAERGLLDGIFLADVFGVYDVYGRNAEAAARHAVQLPNADPTLLVSAMALVTKHLGFGITSNLTFEHPYQLARTFSTLDHLTKGRIGWNIVTGYLDSGARGMGLPAGRAHDDRYDAAEDFLTRPTSFGKAAGRTTPSAATVAAASLPIPQSSIACGMTAPISRSTASISPNLRLSGRRCCTKQAPRNAAVPSPPSIRKRSFSTARPNQSWPAPSARYERPPRPLVAIPTTSACLPARP